MPSRTAIHTLRHGHTHFNAEKRYAGSIDIPLSEKGVEDCLKAAPSLSRHSFDVVVTSKMQRSIQTARYLLDSKIPLVQSPLCNERNFGVMEGLTWDDIQKFDPPILMINVGNDLHTVNPPGGEPFENVWQRAIRFKRYLFKYHAGKEILVISHGVFLQMFHGLLRGKSCIESLAQYPSNLELDSFVFEDQKLVKEQNENLIAVVEEIRF